mmetsp:Transcript_29353/g.67428  ORF Transcript_29353/g.67428 Transcript_29353/m.67428 type:complete len:145 (+) Transcript_29353:301-735(+)
MCWSAARLKVGLLPSSGRGTEAHFSPHNGGAGQTGRTSGSSHRIGPFRGAPKVAQQSRRCDVMGEVASRWEGRSILELKWSDERAAEDALFCGRSVSAVYDSMMRAGKGKLHHAFYGVRRLLRAYPVRIVVTRSMSHLLPLTVL